MHPNLRACLIILALPLVAILLTSASLWKAEVSVREAVRRQDPALAPAELAAITVASLDRRGAFVSRELPTLYARIRFVHHATLATCALGLALVGGIFLAGRITRNRRDLLLRLFRPGLYLTLGFVALLTAAQAVELACALSFFEAIFFGRVHVVFALGLALGGALAFCAVVGAMFSMLRPVEFRVPGRRARPGEHPHLWAVVNDVCRQLATRPPDHIVLGLEPTFYVTESEVTVGTGAGAERIAGRTLHVSLSLCRLLSLPELLAIVGHEMAHFIGADTAFSQRFFPVYRATHAALVKLGGDAGNVGVAFARMPALSLLGFFLEAFATSEKNLSRGREMEADAVGATVAGPLALATALVKVHACAPLWGDLVKGVRFRVAELCAADNLAVPFAQQAAALSAEAFPWLCQNEIAHPIDSHPPLATRLAALRVDRPALAPA
ncbi:MAG TPA: M48 family metalloprotease, partial [Opitutaceae bacterium]